MWGKLKQALVLKKNNSRGKAWFSCGLGRGDGGGLYSGIMSWGKPVLVSVIYSPRASIEWGSVHNVA